jgi:hypothetical protein
MIARWILVGLVILLAVEIVAVGALIYRLHRRARRADALIEPIYLEAKTFLEQSR